MAVRVPNAASVTTSSLTGWDSAVNTATMHASTNVSVNTTARFTATFTAPNTTNACTGALFYVTSGAHSTMTVTLQQSSVDTAATVTLNTADYTANSWVYARFPTPFVFTTTAAGAYRFKVAGTGSTGNLAADSSGTLFAYHALTNVTGALGTSDTLHILQLNTGTPTAVTVTCDDTRTIGTYGDTALPVQRTLGNAVTIGHGGTLTADTTPGATPSLTVKGNTLIFGGEFAVGTTGTPYPSTNTFTYLTNSNVASDHGVYILNTGKFKLQGTPKSAWKTKYVSGLGTAASPMITTGDLGSVGDEILVSATGDGATNYDQTEYRYIITKNSTTSYVLSSTSGGVEAALVHTHTTNAHVLNVQRNIIIKGGNNPSYVTNNNTTVGNFDCDWARFENNGSSITGKLGVQIARTTAMFGDLDYCVAYAPTYAGFIWTTSKYASSHTGLIICRMTVSTGAVGGIYCTSANSKTFTDCFAVDIYRNGIYPSSAFNMRFIRCVAIACNKVGTAATSTVGGFVIAGSSTLDDCEVFSCRNQGVALNSSNSTITDSHIGDYGTNTVEVGTITDTLNTTSFSNCTLGSGTLLNNYSLSLPGSEVSYHNLNLTTNNHTWYTPFGSARSTGAGLVDTTVRTPGSLAVRIAPEDATDGFTWSFNIPAKAYSAVIFNGRFIKNTAFGSSTATVNLYLPGSSTPDATQTLSNTYIETPGAIWDSVVLAGANTTATDGLATIVINGLTATANAYIYCDDFYNAGDTVTNSDKVTGLDTWYEGKPISIISPQVLNIADIWNYPTSVLTSSGTVGNQVKKLLTLGKFIGLK